MRTTRYNIPKTILLPEGEDYNALRKRGIAILEQMAGHTWTDYNEHDPGVTILEQLCYALTEIAYRIRFPVADMLCDEEGNVQTRENAFFSAAQILTSGAVTPKDYRKIIIDAFPEVCNAWINIPKEKDGKYEVYIDSAMAPGMLQLEKINRLLNAQRNLCELFTPATQLSPLSVVLNAEIYINKGTPTEELLAQLILRVKNFINKPIPFYTLSEMEEMGYDADQIFEGPGLRHGFIRTEDLKPRLRELYATSLIKELMSVPGVEGIKKTAFFTEKKAECNELFIGETEVAVLNVEETLLHHITFYAGDAKINCDTEKALNAYHQLKNMHNRNFRPLRSEKELDYLPPTGKYRDLSQYSSIQRQFPLTYGIGEEGLPVSSSLLRKAQAQQLKAYLLFFEQLIADRFAQLANVKSLFSIGGQTQTYFYQPLQDVPGLESLIKPYTDTLVQPREEPENKENDPLADAYLKALHEFIAGKEVYTDRRIAFLDHLLARFAIDVLPYHTPFSESDQKKKEVERKQKLLEKLPELTAGRFQAPEYVNGSYQPSKIQTILALLLDTEDTHPESFDAILNHVIAASDHVPENTGNQEIVVQGRHDELPLFIRYGSSPSGYFIDSRKTKGFLTIQLKTGEKSDAPLIDLAQVPEKEENKAIRLIETLAARFAYLSKQSERFYLVEHILLKNEDSNATGMSNDFYPFRFSLIIPGVSDRFMNESFRHHVRSLLSQFVPAHLSATIIWLDLDEIRFFETLYFEWMRVFQAESETDKNQKAQLSERIAAFLALRQTEKK